MFDSIKYRMMIHNEKKHYSDLLHKQQKNSDKVQKIEPKVNAFAHAYSIYDNYLKTKMPHINIEDYILDKAKTKHEKLNLLSLGSGTGDWEIELLEKNPLKIRCELIDINEELLSGAKDYAKKHNLDLSVKVQDINKIQPDESFYDFVIVRSSLHHFIELEHIFQ